MIYTIIERASKSSCIAKERMTTKNASKAARMVGLLRISEPNKVFELIRENK